MSESTRRRFLQTTACAAAALAAGLAGGSLPAAEKAADRAKEAPKGPSKKKGICGGLHGVAGLAALKVCWYYNWSSNPPAAIPGIEWMPQIFPHKNENIEQSCQRIKQMGFRTLLGFNEPDHPGQSNLTVAEAVAKWPILEKTGLRLVSPATTWVLDGWMRDFMKEAEQKKFRIDAIGIHWYGEPSAESFLKYVHSARKLFDKPIWITEFAIWEKKANAQNPAKFTKEQVLAFLRDVLPELEKLEWVERYCWYNPHKTTDARMGPSCVLDDQGKLTEAGKYYASI